LWSEEPDYWDIVEVLACRSERKRADIVKQYGELRVCSVERDIGMLMSDEIDLMIAIGTVQAENREAKLKIAAARLTKARALASDVKWQLSNGKVRQETAKAEDLAHFWWIADCASSDEIQFDGMDYTNYWINPGALDYISIPAHKFYVEDKKSSARGTAIEEVTKKKRRGS
jgi:hypothetical protein